MMLADGAHGIVFFHVADSAGITAGVEHAFTFFGAVRFLHRSHDLPAFRV